MSSPGAAMFTHGPKFENDERWFDSLVEPTASVPVQAAGTSSTELPSFPAAHTHSTLAAFAWSTSAWKNARVAESGPAAPKLMLSTPRWWALAYSMPSPAADSSVCPAESANLSGTIVDCQPTPATPVALF